MPEPPDSPIVRDVREAREKLAKECGNDLQRLLELLKEEERASGCPTATPRPKQPR